MTMVSTVAAVGSGTPHARSQPLSCSFQDAPIRWAFPPRAHPRLSFGRSINSHSLGRQPKAQFRLPINSHYPFPRIPEGSFECHSCLVMNYIANNRYPHNPKVGGSNPSPATNPSNKLQVSKRNLKTILDHINVRFRVFVYNRIRRFYLQDHLNYIAVCPPLAVRHRPAVHIHRCLNAGMAH